VTDHIMTDHIAQALWIGYLEDALDPGERTGVDRHLSLCPECSRLLADFEDCEAALASEAAVLRRELGMSEESAVFLAGEALSVLHRQAAVAAAALRRFTVYEGVRILQSVLDPIYGPAIVERVFRMAAITCSASVADGLEAHQWPEFAATLDLAASEIWGGAAGRAVRRLTAHLPVERAT